MSIFVDFFCCKFDSASMSSLNRRPSQFIYWEHSQSNPFKKKKRSIYGCSLFIVNLKVLSIFKTHMTLSNQIKLKRKTYANFPVSGKYKTNCTMKIANVFKRFMRRFLSQGWIYCSSRNMHSFSKRMELFKCNWVFRSSINSYFILRMHYNGTIPVWESEIIMQTVHLFDSYTMWCQVHVLSLSLNGIINSFNK